MRILASLAFSLWALLGTVDARDTLFGRSVRDTGQSSDADTANPEPKKPKDEPKRPKAASTVHDQSGEAKSDAGGADATKGDKDAPRDEGVRVRPLVMDKGVEPKARMDFQLSRIDKPLARETTATFREAWAAFRRQNQITGQGERSFARLPQAPAPLKARLLQDLGDGRWLVDAEWANPGLFDWCPAGANADKAVLVLDAGEGKVGETLEVNAVHVGLVELRFDCEVPPAAGRRVTIRRHAFMSTPVLPDDEATRALFQQAVAAEKAPVSVMLVQVRDCKACGGLGYVRRAVPGKIQDAHDPCPEACDRGHQQLPVLVTFRP